ncbi:MULTISPECIES: aminoacetone oxidase family FAD-binding enzyme [Gordonibacter]|uniref:aminoacetone oxidase family FAD-binding enzyme n=1 Tax=Gordonibacter TaxID=644652 RepID=UPI001D4BED16|nr:MULTISPECIES: aminoacetone oxidase family FAD-binding enzyme [Gordonibacter]MDN4510448.1 aminoacetone oxidase family FAD-binding enzyme [Gordonibacter sp. RACS_AR49]HJF64395.1 aminoacetone oxidase family FAD-binding enzyme [Gordonibacter urolithinfaciens]
MGRLAIIGGGAAGLAAAVTAARELRMLGVPGDVAVYEADERVGRSILATGNGRCNFSNARIDAGAYRNAAFVGSALGALTAGSDPVHAFFADLGLVWREEGEGRLYPLANKATSVLDVLRAAAADFGVREACGRRAVRLDVPDHPGGRFHIRFADGTVGHADAVVLATGGRTARELLPEGIGFAAARPVLGPLRTATDVVRHLNNLRVRCAVTLAGPDGAPKARETGELLFRDYGVSGIAVFNLSRFAEPGDRLLVDLLPQMPEEDCAGFLHARRRRLSADGRPLSREAFLRGMLLPAVARAVLEEAGLAPGAPLAKCDVPALAAALKTFPLEVRGIGDERQCQVRRGGADVAAFDPRTLEARAVPGLHVVGEALDVDAPCGGYNLHWAWASGILAGRAAATRLMGPDDVAQGEGR